MAKKEASYEVVISGSGVMGLTLAKNLSSYGLSVAVLERASQFASGSSIRNEGWLHAGTYHAAAIRNENDAGSVVTRTQAGYGWVLNNYPDVIEDPKSQTFALLSDPEQARFTTDRWDSMQVPYKPVGKPELVLNVPNVNSRNIEAAFQVVDRSINTRQLYTKIMDDCVGNGVQFFNDTEITSFNNSNQAEVASGSSDIDSIRGFMFVHTVGYGLKEVLDKLGSPGNVRYWKSHLLVTPRLARDNIFFMEPGEAGVMHHKDKFGGEKSIVGTNVDAIFLAQPDTVVDERKVEEMNNAGARLFSDWNRDQEAVPYACVKTDVDPDDPLPRLTPSILTPAKSHYIVLPGKMTEAPSVAQTLTGDILKEAAAYIFSKVISRQGDRSGIVSLVDYERAIAEVSNRPCDVPFAKKPA